MKTIIAALLLLATSAAHAWEHDEWRKSDTVREVVWQVINLADLGTTLDIAKSNDAAGRVVYRERNPVLGPDPSPERVTALILLGAVAHAGVSYALPAGWRDAWQYISIGKSLNSVDNNLSLGLRLNF